MCKQAGLSSLFSSPTLHRRSSAETRVWFSPQYRTQASNHLRTVGRRIESSLTTCNASVLPELPGKRPEQHKSFQVPCQRGGVVGEEDLSVVLQPSCASSSRGEAEVWLEKAIFEIVGHLQDAPFLHLVYDTEPFTWKSKLQKVSDDVLADPEKWSYVKNSLVELSPDGIILVQRLQPSSLGKTCIAGLPEDACGDLVVEGTDNDTDVWGLFVQAKSLGWNACYVLKTTRVLSTCGACTRFYLTRAKCFGAALATQMQNAWLL